MGEWIGSGFAPCGVQANPNLAVFEPDALAALVCLDQFRQGFPIINNDPAAVVYDQALFC